jgi:hypothetical protein
MKGSSEAKKPKGALVAVAFGAPRSRMRGGSEAEAEEDYPDVDPSSDAFTSFADAVGLDPAKRVRAEAALKQFVKACYGTTEESAEEEL